MKSKGVKFGLALFLAVLGFIVVATAAEDGPPSYIYGRWTVARLIPTSNIQVAPQDLNPIIGTVATYSASRVKFGSYVVKSPKYRLRRESANQFFEEATFDPREIGIRGQSVDTITILDGHGRPVTAPGMMLFIRGKNALVTTWDGGYFEMVRRK